MLKEMKEPKANDNWKSGKGNGFYALSKKGKLVKWILRCPECGRENYAMSVATGHCAWCGHTENEKK
jgi:ribosomal protein L37E